MRCAIYARFSTDRQSETSAEDQVRECRRRAEAQGWEVVDVYTDLAISGASNRRPGMTGMLADATAGSFDIVLSEALDRMARDQADIATIYKRLSFAGVRIETLSEGAVNELHIGLKGTMGALFLKDLADKIRRGQRGSLARGRIPGGLCYGYDVVREIGPDHKIDAGRRRINPEQAAVVRRILEEYAAGKGSKAIAQGLNADGIKSPRGGEWRASAIIGNRARKIGILHNPIYVGRYAYNRVTMKRDPESRNRVSRPNPASELQIVDMPELRIVPDELWQRVQDALDDRASQPLVRRKRPRHLFSGLVKCGLCGGAYTVVADTRLACARSREAGTCDNRRRLQLAELQSRVFTALETQLLSPEAVSLLVREFHVDRERRLKDETRSRRSIERRLAGAEAAVKRLVAAVAGGGAEFTDLREALAGKVRERDEARSALAEIEADTVVALHPGIADAYRQRIRALTAGLDAGETSEATKESIRSLVEAVYVRPADGGELELELFTSFDSAIALATGRSATRGTSRAVTVVAEEGLEPPTRGL